MNTNFYCVLDTETTNDIDCPLVYDIGWSIVTPNGETVVSHSFAVKEIFIDEKDLMQSAYYAEKIPNYWREIWNGERQIETFFNIRRLLAKECEQFGVKAICRHNARFDYLALTTTQRWLTKSKYRYFFPYGVEIFDTLKMARKTFGIDDDYIKFCKDNGYMTNHKKPQPRMTAEILYRYITDFDNFEESHTGIDDVAIETEIFVECYRRMFHDTCNLWK